MSDAYSPEKVTNQKVMRDIADEIADRINQYCIKKFGDEEQRSHLGASLIGHDCSRYLWSHFRWLKNERFSAPMLRLFNDGKMFEAQAVEYLAAVGVTDYKSFAFLTENQHRFSSDLTHGHFGGSSDGIGSYRGLPIVVEIKTHNEKSFNKLLDKGVHLTKPMHYAQMCSYGKQWSIKHGLYVAYCKNDSRIHVDLALLDWKLAEDYEKRARDVVFSQQPLERVALQPTHWQCKLCVFQGICFYSEPPSVNCRSCRHASAIENAQWKCARYGTIPKDYIPHGCGDWQSIV